MPANVGNPEGQAVQPILPAVHRQALAAPQGGVREAKSSAQLQGLVHTIARHARACGAMQETVL